MPFRGCPLPPIATWLRRLITDLYLGRASADAGVFGFDR
jgi:hypothetical protein